jgi:hypothetical protein
LEKLGAVAALPHLQALLNDHKRLIPALKSPSLKRRRRPLQPWKQNANNAQGFSKFDGGLSVAAPLEQLMDGV